jgi:hypothetical protein
MNADDKYEQQNDYSQGPTGEQSTNDYVSRTGQREIRVQKDEAFVEDPIDPATADSDQQLGKWEAISHSGGCPANVYTARDEKEAIDTHNIVKGRTRGATKKAGTYQEPGDEAGLPGPDDGTSSTR